METPAICLSIRPARIDDCDDLGLVIVTASMSAFLGRVPEQDLDYSWTPQVSAANWKRDFESISESGALFYVAECEGRVIGYVLAKRADDPRDFEWNVSALYVLPSMQRRGVGRELLSHLARELHRRGVRTLQIGCVKENPSCGFYQRLGGIEVGRRSAMVDRYQTEEILFGWNDIAVLME